MVSKVDLLVLGLLTDRPMHGYEISQVIAAEEIEAWLSVSLTSIYYSLNKLKKNGLIVETVHRSDNSPERSVFHLTDKGRASFLDLLERSLGSSERVYFDLDLAVYFINRLPSKTAGQLLERRQRFVAALRQEMTDRAVAIKRRSGPSPKLAIVEHSRRFLELEAAWLEEFAAAVGGDGAAPAPGGRPGHVMTLLGDLQAMHLPDVLKFVAAGRLTGRLTVRDSATQHVLSFDDGSPVRLDTTRGGAAAADTESALRAFAEVFRWPAGRIAFEQCPADDENGFPIDSSVEQLIIAGARGVDGWGPIQRYVPSMETVFERRSSGLVDALPLNERERQVALALDGTSDVRRVSAGLGLSEFETSRALYSLFALGALVTVEPDMVRVRQVVRRLAETPLHTAEVLGGLRTVRECEQAVNSRLGAGAPVRFADGHVSDHTEPLGDAGAAAQAYLAFLRVAIDVLADRIGRGLVVQTLQRTLQEATPDVQDAAARYGFSRLVEIAAGRKE